MSKTSIIAHRGGGKYAPANTIPAFKKAIDLGARSFETDIHRTKDNKLVLCHNKSVNATSDGKGKIINMTLKELKEYDFGKKYSDDYKDTKIPTLDELLQLIKINENKIDQINLELKPPAHGDYSIVFSTVEAVRKYGLVHKLIISSFDEKILATAKGFDSNVKTALLCPKVTTAFSDLLRLPIKKAVKYKADAINPPTAFLNKHRVKKAHKTGLKVYPWTVNKRRLMRKMVRYGVDGIITDLPDAAQKEINIAEFELNDKILSKFPNSVNIPVRIW